MDIQQITVSLTPAAAARLIKAHMSYAELIHEERHRADEKEIAILIYEKYYMRNNSQAGLTVTISNFDGPTRVNIISFAGGQGLLGLSWGASGQFAGKVAEILASYRV
ncbi:MAG: DUF6054 family protein [Christensenellales bacterium]|jgi:hypothetical protein